MKLLLSLCATLLLASLASAKEGWLDNLEKAKIQAKAEHKEILLDFTGSDWCVICHKIEKEVFSQQEFKEYAAKHLVLVELDFPQTFELPAATKKQNEALQEKYRIDQFPTLIVLTAAGAKKGQFGYTPGGPSAFIKELENAK